MEKVVGIDLGTTIAQLQRKTLLLVRVNIFRIKKEVI